MLKSVRKVSRENNLPRRYDILSVEAPVEGHLSTTNIRAKRLGLDMTGGRKTQSPLLVHMHYKPLPQSNPHFTKLTRNGTKFIFSSQEILKIFFYEKMPLILHIFFDMLHSASLSTHSPFTLSNIIKVGCDTNLLSDEITYHIDIRMKKNLSDFKIVHDLATIAGLKRVQWI